MNHGSTRSSSQNNDLFKPIGSIALCTLILGDIILYTV